MVITKIEYQKNDPQRVSLFIDGKFFCGISIDTLARESLYEGLKLESDDLNRITNSELYQRFLTRCVDYIARSPKTEFQIKKYLHDLRFKKKDIWFTENIDIEWEDMFERILTQLTKYKYIDDENYARLFVQSRLRLKPRGKSVLIGELLSKGVNKEIAEGVCEEEVEDEYSLLLRTYQKRFKEKKFDRRDSKMVGYLLRKGFSWDLIEKLEQDDSKE